MTNQGVTFPIINGVLTFYIVKAVEGGIGGGAKMKQKCRFCTEFDYKKEMLYWIKQEKRVITITITITSQSLVY